VHELLIQRQLPAGCLGFAKLPALKSFQLCELVNIVSYTCDVIIVELVLEIHRRNALQRFLIWAKKIFKLHSFRRSFFNLKKGCS